MYHKDVPGAEHLTFVDKMRASVKPITGTNDSTGLPNFPRHEFLVEQAAERKRAIEAEKKRGG
jgi:hypothetical protein